MVRERSIIVQIPPDDPPIDRACVQLVIGPEREARKDAILVLQ